MRNLLIMLIILLSIQISVKAQQEDSIKKITLTDSYGNTSNLDVEHANGPILFVIYGPGCGICIKELNNISKKIEKWETLYNVEIIAFSRKYKRDYSRNLTKLKEKQGYKFPLYIDSSGDLARYLFNAFGADTTSFSKINGLHLMVPSTMLLSKENKVIYQKQGYQAGDEDKIEEIMKIMNKND